jgi:hypothetical protein
VIIYSHLPKRAKGFQMSNLDRMEVKNYVELEYSESPDLPGEIQDAPETPEEREQRLYEGYISAMTDEELLHESRRASVVCDYLERQRNIRMVARVMDAHPELGDDALIAFIENHGAEYMF